MKIGVIGAGAMGGFFGGMLDEAGQDVHLHDTWADHVRAIGADGLRLDFPDGGTLVTHPRATTDPTAIGPVDLAIVFVKAHHTHDALDGSAAMIGEDTVALTLQNGLGLVDALVDHVPRDRVLGGATTNGAEVQGPGHVRVSGRGVNKLGGADRTAADRVGAVLGDAGLETEVVDDPEPYVWEKQFISVGLKPLAALTELLDGPIAEFGPTWDVVRTLIREAMDVARARGVEIVSDDPIADTYDLCLNLVYDGKSSMLEDVEFRRATEIDFINGAVVDYADELGIDVPYNRMATALVRGKERSYLESDA